MYKLISFHTFQCWLATPIFINVKAFKTLNWEKKNFHFGYNYY